MELLAPAGTHETFWAALDSGADAVYVGLRGVNARALARNFSIEEIAGLTEIAHSADKRLFVAMNSLVKEDEIPRAVEALSALQLIGVDALIIQDLGLWRIARAHFPALPLHASTLMAIHNSAGVKMASLMGFHRVVLAREMTLDEIRAASSAAPIDTEVFVHGAMCFSYSGLCLFSSYFGGKSGLRGRCVQPCRRRYLWEEKNGAFFSMGDLCGLDAVEDLRLAGVRTLKIEGRLRPPRYVASVVKAYRMVMDRPGDKAALSSAMDLVKDALGRPYTRGYFYGPSPGDAIHPQRMANTGKYIGRVLEQKGETLLVEAKMRPEGSSRLRIVHRGGEEQKSFLCIGVEDAGDGRFLLKADAAINAPRGAFVFQADVTRVAADPRIPPARRLTGGMKRFGALIRKARLEAQGILMAMREANGLAGDKGSKNKKQSHRIWIRLSDPRHLPFLKRIDITGVNLPVTRQNLRLLRGKKTILSGAECLWSLPSIINESEIAFYKEAVKRLMGLGFKRFEVGSLGTLGILLDVYRGRGLGGKGRVTISGSYTLNLLNSQALLGAKGLGIEAPQFSIETDKENARLALAHAYSVRTAFTIFSYPPVFTSRMDLKAFRQRGVLTSPKGEHFYWRSEGGMGFLVPDRPFSLLNRQDDLKETGFSAWVIDLSHWLKSRRMPRGMAPDIKTLSRMLHGKAFNFFDGLG